MDYPSTNPQFITADLYLVAFFLLHGIKWRTTSFDGRTVSFCYPMTPQCVDLQEAYRADGFHLKYRDAMDEVWEAITAIKRQESQRDE